MGNVRITLLGQDPSSYPDKFDLQNKINDLRVRSLKVGTQLANLEGFFRS